MRYFSLHNGDHKLVGIGTGIGGNEITKEEYDEIFDEIREKAALVDRLYSGEITIDDVPTEWQAEIQRRMDERIAAEGEAAEQPVSGDEFLSMREVVL